jgi:ketosteroid isomerase-like protein
MNRLAFVLLAVIASAGTLADDAEDAGAKLYEYFAEFNEKDIKTIANHIYSTPVHIGGGTGHRVFTSPADAVRNLTGLYEQIEAQGWVESRIDDLKVCVASETLALVDTRYSRIDQDGKPIPPAIRTTVYVLQKIDGDWRIVAFYGHDNDRRPSC